MVTVSRKVRVQTGHADVSPVLAEHGGGVAEDIRLRDGAIDICKTKPRTPPEISGTIDAQIQSFRHGVKISGTGSQFQARGQNFRHSARQNGCVLMAGMCALSRMVCRWVGGNLRTLQHATNRQEQYLK